MKISKIITLFLFAASMMLFTACGGVDMKSADSVGKHYCEMKKKRKELRDKDDKEGLKTLRDEMDKFEKDVEAANKDNWGEFENKIEEWLDKNCK